MKTFDEIARSYDALAAELLAFISAQVPLDGATRSFHVDYLRQPHPNDEDCIVLLHAVRRIGDDVCVLGYAADEDQVGDAIDPIAVADFLLDELYSIAGQLAD